jgi:hypothetical protein
MTHGPMGLYMHTVTKAVNPVANWVRDTDTLLVRSVTITWEHPSAGLNHRG